MLSIPLVLLPLLALVGFNPVRAQDKSVENYPQWVTNDYNCVIGCLQIFNDSVKDRPSPKTEVAANQCIFNTCDKNVMGMNIYQSYYIIQMFYATGSIYEDPNMGQWGQGTPPTQNDAVPPPPSEHNGQNPQSAPASEQGNAAPATSSQPNPTVPPSQGPSQTGSQVVVPSSSSLASAVKSGASGLPQNSTISESGAGRHLVATGKLPVAITGMIVILSGLATLPIL